MQVRVHFVLRNNADYIAMYWDSCILSKLCIRFHTTTLKKSKQQKKTRGVHLGEGIYTHHSKLKEQLDRWSFFYKYDDLQGALIYPHELSSYYVLEKKVLNHFHVLGKKPKIASMYWHVLVCIGEKKLEPLPCTLLYWSHTSTSEWFLICSPVHFSKREYMEVILTFFPHYMSIHESTCIWIHQAYFLVQNVLVLAQRSTELIWPYVCYWPTDLLNDDVSLLFHLGKRWNE